MCASPSILVELPFFAPNSPPFDMTGCSSSESLSATRRILEGSTSGGGMYGCVTSLRCSRSRLRDMYIPQCVHRTWPSAGIFVKGSLPVFGSLLGLEAARLEIPIDFRLTLDSRATTVTTCTVDVVSNWARKFASYSIYYCYSSALPPLIDQYHTHITLCLQMFERLQRHLLQLMG